MDLAPDRRIDLQAQNQPCSGLQSIGSISIRSERTEKTACIRVVRSGISCGIDAGCEGPLTAGLCRNTRRRRPKKRSSPVAGERLSLTDDERP